MKQQFFVRMMMVVGLLLVIGGCAFNQKPGVVVVEEITKTATVVAIDQENHAVTLKFEDGIPQTYILSDAVKNFDQIKTGDQVVLSALESIAVYVRKTDERPEVMQNQSIKLAPKGSKPGMVMSETTEITAKIEAIDQEKHIVTIRELNGNTRTLKVNEDAKNFHHLKVDDSVVLNVTKAVIVAVKKPEGAPASKAQ